MTKSVKDGFTPAPTPFDRNGVRFQPQSQRELRHSGQRGFTLLEILIALFVITTGLIGVAALMGNNLSSMTVISSRLTAAYLAQEGIELVRSLRDGNWLEQVSWDDGLSGCNPSLSIFCEMDYDDENLTTVNSPEQARFLLKGGGFYSYNVGGSATKFKRKITISPEDADTLVVGVEVAWRDKGKDYNIVVKGKLYNWK